MIKASAPGKLLLCGEYAVLRGAPAVVVAVGALATARVERAPGNLLATPAGDFPFDISADSGLRWRGADPAERGLLLAALLKERPAAERARHSPPLRIELDSSGFALCDATGQAAKIGLGSSAAVLVALAAALARAWSPSLSPAAFQDWCLRAHRDFQRGRGSGVDVLTAIHGGLLAVDPAGKEPVGEPLTWPDGLQAVVAWSGRAASTPAMIDAFDTVSHSHPGLLRALNVAAAAAKRAWCSGDASAIIEASSDYASALQQLDDVAAMGIVTSEHARLAAIARAAGAVYKTSGAGGGDLGFALSDSLSVAADIRARFNAAGFRVLDLPLAVPGVAVTGDY